MKIKLNNSALVFAKKMEIILYDYSNASLQKGKVLTLEGKTSYAGETLSLLLLSLCEGGSIVRLTNFCTPTTPTQLAIAFYTGEGEETFISGVERLQRDEKGAELQDIDIPTGAKYIRCTYWANSEIVGNNYPPFVCKVMNK